MTAQKSHNLEIIVGIFILLGITVISVLVFTIAGKQKLFEPRYKITAVFGRVSGLKVGAPVRLAGLEVGSVESLDFTPQGKVLAVLSIQSKFQKQIRLDSEATISSVGILGDKSVEITIGSPQRRVLMSGDRIPSKDPFDVSGFIDHVAPMAAKVDEILTYLSQITGEFSMNNLPVAETLEHAKNILEKLDRGTGSIGSAINDPALYRSLVDLAEEGKSASLKLQKTLDRIEPTTQELPSLISSTRKVIEEIHSFFGDLRESAAQFPAISKQMAETSKNVRTASEDLPEITGSFRRAGRGAEDVIQSMKKNWFIRRNLPEPSFKEDRILLDDANIPPESAP